MKKRTLLLVLSTLAAMAACSKSGNEPAAQQAPAKAASAPVQRAMPANHPQIGAMGSAPASATGTPQQGKVLSVTQVSGYTYLQVETGGHKTWMATSPVEAKAGDTVKWNGGIVMHNFASKSLHRTFDKLVLLQHVDIVK